MKTATHKQASPLPAAILGGPKCSSSEPTVLESATPNKGTQTNGDRSGLSSAPTESISKQKSDLSVVPITHDGAHFPSSTCDAARFATLEPDFSWAEEEDRVILSPYDYLVSETGKEIRTLIINAFNAWFEVAPERLTVICDVVRMLHTSSLLIDDIQDDSLLRRGEPVAHSIYGIAQTINAANYVYFLAANELVKLSNAAAALESFQAEMLNLHRGQGQELFWRDTLTCPSEEEYLKMVSNKTGGLFRMAVRLMQTEASDNGAAMAGEFDYLVWLLGLAFQIADDYRNLTAVEYTTSKGYCEDLTEGKFSFPVVHSIQTNPSDQRLLHILAQKTTDFYIKKQAVEYMESTGSLDYTKRVVGLLIQRARDEVHKIDQGRGKSKEILQLLNKMALQ